MALIIPGGSGDPRLQAARNPYQGDVHGLTSSQIEALNAKYESFLPKLVTLDPELQRSKLLEEDFRKMGASRAPFRKRGFGGQVIPGATNMGQGTMVSAQTPYQPEFSSQDRQQYPVHRILANRYWRLFHKLDPVVGNCLDLYSEVPWSPFQLTGEGLDGEIKDHFETMCEQLELLALLPYMTREYLVVGEVFPHCFYDSDKHMWDYVTAHNPDQIEIIDAPFIRMDPIIELIPDQRLRAILSSGDPMLQKVREQMPSELLGRLLARQNVPLDNLNCTTLSRKLHPYDVRGTSILSRLWRVFMLEDAVFSATIATARRHAGPIKIAKLGNPQTGWIPGPEHEARLLELLAQAELDPHAFLVYHFGVQFEAFGTTDRVISVGREWETLERIKLVGLGVSKCFAHDTLITLADGSKAPIQNISAGDRVIAHDGSEQEVVEAWCEGAPDKLVEIETKGGKKFLVTGNHKFPVWAWPRVCACGCGKSIKKTGRIYAKGCYKHNTAVSHQHVNSQTTHQKARRIPDGYDPVQQLCAEDIRIGDCLLVPRKFEEVETDVSTAQARLLGYYLAEGYIVKGRELGGNSHGSGFILTFGDDVVDICRELNCDVFVRPRDGVKCTAVGSQSSDNLRLTKWLQSNGGEYAVSKRLSREVMHWPIGLKIELIRGAFRGDGTRYHTATVKKKDGEWSQEFSVKYATISETLSSQLQLILAQIGVFATMRVKNPSGFGKKPQFNLTICGIHAVRLAEIVWGDKIDHTGHLDSFLVDDKYIRLPVKSIRIVDNSIRRVPVYNLSVSGMHTYLADNVASCNSFLHGEVTYASAATGLQVFLQRLLTMRNWFETKWILKKLFKPISEINEFVKPSQAELNHRVRIRRTAKELNDDKRYVVPSLQWDKPLDPNVDRDLISAAESLTRIGVKFSRKTLMSFINRKFEDELKSSLEEEAAEARARQEYQSQLGPAGQGPAGTQPSQMTVEQFEQMQSGGQPKQLPPAPGQPGGPPVTQPPPRPGVPPVQSQQPQMPQQAEAPRRTPMLPPGKKYDWRDGNLGNWDVENVEAVLELFRTGRTDDPFWTQAVNPQFKSYIATDDYLSAWDDLVLFLEQFGYPDEDINKLHIILESEDIFPHSDLDQILEAMPEDVGSDADAEAAFLAAFRKEKGNGISRFSVSSLIGNEHGGGGTVRRPFRKSR